jgi:hypothetical protein
VPPYHLTMVCHLTTLPWCATLPPYHGVPPYHLTMVCHLPMELNGVPPYHLTMVCHLTTLPWCATLPPYHGVPPYHGASKLIAYARSRISLEVARKGGYLTCWHEGKGDWDVFSYNWIRLVFINSRKTSKGVEQNTTALRVPG